jgi:hypothetical protein
MSSTSDPASLPAGRGRKFAIALLILLLILLPLYLWPLRSGLGALPWAATLTAGPQKDPRDPAALAGIPSEVWEALLNEASGTAHGSAGSHEGLAPQNLTMITPEAGNIPGIPEPGSADSLSGLLSADEPPSGLLISGIGPIDGESGDPDPSPSSTAGSSTAGPFDSWPLAGGGQGNAGPWPSGGSGGVGSRNLGLPTALGGLPFGGEAPDLASPVVLVLSPGDPVAPHPAPEPGTVALVGLNLVLLATVAWNHRRYKEARPRIR